MESLFKVIIIVIFVFGGTSSLDDHQKSDDVAIKVNDTEINKEDFDILSDQILEQYKIYDLGKPSEEEIIDEAVQQVILLDYAISKGKEVTSEEINEEIRKIVDMYDMETEEELIEELGVNSINELERALRREIKTAKLIDHYKGEINIREEEIQHAYNEYYMEMKDAGQEVPSIDEMRDQIKNSLKEENAILFLASNLEEFEKEVDVEVFVKEEDVSMEGGGIGINKE